MDIQDIYAYLVCNGARIEAELIDRLTNHPNTDSTNALKAAIKNRQIFSSAEPVKTYMLDKAGTECLLFIQLFGFAHNRVGAQWSEDTIIKWVNLCR